MAPNPYASTPVWLLLPPKLATKTQTCVAFVRVSVWVLPEASNTLWMVLNTRGKALELVLRNEPRCKLASFSRPTRSRGNWQEVLVGLLAAVCPTTRRACAQGISRVDGSLTPIAGATHSLSQPRSCCPLTELEMAIRCVLIVPCYELVWACVTTCQAPTVCF